MAMITRTIVKETLIDYRTVKDGVVSEQKRIAYAGMVGNPVAIIKKAEGLKKTDSVIIDGFNEVSNLYGCTVEEFMSVAHIIEK